ncbi:biopolymer transporter ExbD [Fibrobacter sp. UWB1]|jgi:biopolymer transport protein ExbD|uniref:ExbD/TolR family protein n=1 Tax=Fibrobacter TaxID=832 RepID=UPI0009176790|nr:MULTISPECIES: biopolymer transporter ExbD [Fibrobacter]MBO5531332.1 biopolymer transporter ExbD [Fibrobacter sp.]MBO6135018.1 biopolymer transporter ExbD [Fibrobacter sp.]MBQ3720507.1 biopolymer transporter ExbD [Fibrobacter sp.]MBR2059676.1 biopolymer transporter ExbD [Fibrobacter sp.]MBR2308816.1 biopolymer transporter ExbD [Fibrobacter sp.]
MAKRTRRIRPDMTPLIDCVFLLLVFFLVTSVFKQDESVLKLILPETQTETKRDTPEGLYIELSETELAFNGQRGTPDELREKAATVQNKKSPVAIKIDKGTTYERIAVILDILQVQKLYNIQLINEMESAE